MEGSVRIDLASRNVASRRALIYEIYHHSAYAPYPPPYKVFRFLVAKSPISKIARTNLPPLAPPTIS